MPGERPWSVAMLETLLAQRMVSAFLLIAAAAHFIAVWAGASVAPCPMHSTTGLPCPGCGLSRAGIHLIQGRLVSMVYMHPFAPYFALLGLMLAGAALLPRSARVRWAARWIALERRARVHAVLLTAFMLYGAGRLLWSAVRPG